MAQKQREERVVIVASERLSSTGREWVEVPNNSMLTVTPGLTVLLKPIAVPSVTQLLHERAQACEAAVEGEEKGWEEARR